MDKKELDRAVALQASGHTPLQVLAKLQMSRANKDMDGPNESTVRRALRGVTHKRALKETRGRPAKLTPAQLRRLDNARKELIRKARGLYEVHISDVKKKAKVSHVSDSTVSLHFKKKLGVTWRIPREAPLRLDGDAEQRVKICSKMKYYADNYFTEQVDAFWDNKQFYVPTYEKAKVYQKMTKVRGHLRTRGEGITKNFTKPKSNKNRVNPGAKVSVCCAIMNNKVKVWEYLPSRWCAQAASDLYRGPLIRALRKFRGNKSAYHVVEDNDPTGYKSRKQGSSLLLFLGYSHRNHYWFLSKLPCCLIMQELSLMALQDGDGGEEGYEDSAHSFSSLQPGPHAPRLLPLVRGGESHGFTDSAQ